MGGMDTLPPERPRVPQHFAAELPRDAAAILHRVKYETGRSKVDLVAEAIRQVYGEGRAAA
jgi:hypothetical protein